ncbi:MAG: hypothetical protein D6788_01440, partial [Planctomycetota bacterium]
MRRPRRPDGGSLSRWSPRFGRLFNFSLRAAGFDPRDGSCRHPRPPTERPVRRLGRCAVVAGIAWALVLPPFGCRRNDPPNPTGNSPAAPEPSARPSGWLTDITEASGLDFVHDAGATGDLHLAEIMGGGV